MAHTIELTLILSKILSGLASWALVGVMILGSWFIYDRLDKPNFLKRMRTLCKAYRIFVILLIILRVIQVAGLFFEARHYTQPSTFDILFDWAFAIFLLGVYLKYYRYYLKQRDDKNILSGWYMRKHLSLAKKKQLQPAYECLQKAAELTPDSVGVWGTLASFSEVFFEDLQLSDEYLVKAQHAYEKSENKIPDNLAILEHYKGKTMQYRDNHQAAVIHLKKAYELAPTNYRKKEYKTALKWANEDEESTTS